MTTMNRRHITAVLAGGVLMLLAIFGSGVSCARAAETKVPPPAPPAIAAKTAPAAPSAAPAAKAAAAATAAPAAPAMGPAAAKATAAAPAAQTTAPATAPGAPATAAAVAETKEAPPAYSYSPSGKSDPFKPFMETEPPPPKKPETEANKKAPVKGTPRMPISPLQQGEIEQFRLIGIAGDDTKRNALVEDRVSKKYYPLAVGTVIGTNTGRVVSILPDRVIIEERIGTQAKQVQIRRMTLMLHTEDEGKK
jgi:Tfp pilus assembly protein PilP